MPKITDYDKTTVLKKENILLVDGVDGTKTITAENAAMQLLELLLLTQKDVDSIPSAIMHRNIYRGKNLGDTITDAQKTAIDNGTFEDIYVGDYWYIDNVKYRVMDIDYWYNSGNIPFKKHHLVIMPDSPVKTEVQMYETTPTGSDGKWINYANSPGRAVAQAITLPATLNDALLLHSEAFITETFKGSPVNAGWSYAGIEIPSEIMIFGHNVHGCPPRVTASWTSMSIGATEKVDVIAKLAGNYTNSSTQLAGIRLCPTNINPSRSSYWLRDTVSESLFSYVLDNYMAAYAGATNKLGIRPVFAIGKPDEVEV